MLAAKVITLFVEAAMAIPFIGGIVVIASGYSMLYIAAVLHLLTGIVAIVKKEYGRSVVHWIGLVGNALAWIPFFGWFIHALVTIWILIEIATEKKTEKSLAKEEV